MDSQGVKTKKRNLFNIISIGLVVVSIILSAVTFGITRTNSLMSISIGTTGLPTFQYEIDGHGISYTKSVATDSYITLKEGSLKGAYAVTITKNKGSQGYLLDYQTIADSHKSPLFFSKRIPVKTVHKFFDYIQYSEKESMSVAYTMLAFVDEIGRIELRLMCVVAKNSSQLSWEGDRIAMQGDKDMKNNRLIVVLPVGGFLSKDSVSDFNTEITKHLENKKIFRMHTANYMSVELIQEISAEIISDFKSVGIL